MGKRCKYKYTLGNLKFTSQGAVREHFQAIKSGGRTTITMRSDASSFAFLRDVYWRNPYAPGMEPTAFHLVNHENHGGKEKGMIATLVDGTVTEILSSKFGLRTSDEDMLTGPWKKWRTIQSDWLKAKMRAMVKYQRDMFKDNHPTGKCSCGAPGVEVDHKDPWTFVEIRNSWLEDVDVLNLTVVDDTPDHAQPRFSDHDLYASWLDHHMTYADLQLLCKACHKKETKRRAEEKKRK